MNRKTLFLTVLLMIVFSLALPIRAHAQGPDDDQVVFGGNYLLEENQTLNGDLVVFGGNATLKSGSRIQGDVAVMGGNLNADGTINGNLVALGGNVVIGDNAILNGDLTILGSSLERSPEAVIRGNLITSEEFPFNWESFSRSLPEQGNLPFFRFTFQPLISLMWFFVKLLIWASLAVLIVLFFEEQEKEVSRTAFSHLGMSFAAGLGVILIAPVIILALIITILLIPFSPVALLILAAGWIMGWVALGLEVGERIAKSFDQTWSPLISAALGTFLVLLIFNGFQQIMPWCIGWLPKFAVGLWMIGAVALTRFGSRSYPEVSTPHQPEALPPIEEEQNPDSE